MPLQLLSGTIVVSLALGSACAAGLPGLAAWRSSSTQRAMNFALLGVLPVLLSVLYVYLAASAGFPLAAAVSAAVSA